MDLNNKNKVMIKFIYLILVHENPQQIERLINALNDEKSVFYLHLDSKSDLSEFMYLADRKNVKIISERVDCIWADFSLVLATMSLIKEALNNHSSGMCVLLSGSDYPIKSLSNIQSYLDKNYNKILIALEEAENIWESFTLRTDYYKINLSSKRGDFLLLKGLNLRSLKHLLLRNISFKQFLKVIFIKGN